ncbi:MAG: hypothetical protein LBV55_03025, partial [Acholeplasmatales bacterium]|nr:hypothetical protein [Acholeplasmatales bacterium]
MEKDPNFLKITFEKLNRKFNQNLEGIFSCHDIHRSEFIILVCVVKKESITLKSITQSLFLNKSQVSRGVKVLVDKGILEIIYKEGFKTKYNIVPTAKGMDIYLSAKKSQNE